jgi:hypothetical protein
MAVRKAGRCRDFVDRNRISWPGESRLPQKELSGPSLRVGANFDGGYGKEKT